MFRYRAPVRQHRCVGIDHSGVAASDARIADEQTRWAGEDIGGDLHAHRPRNHSRSDGDARRVGTRWPQGTGAGAPGGNAQHTCTDRGRCRLAHHRRERLQRLVGGIDESRECRREVRRAAARVRADGRRDCDGHVGRRAAVRILDDYRRGPVDAGKGWFPGVA